MAQTRARSRRSLWRKAPWKSLLHYGANIYRDVSKQLQAVNGDMTEVRYVPGFSDAAHVLLKNIEHTSRKLPGTQETRRLMRFATQAFRIRYGNAIFVMFSLMKAKND